MRIDLNPSSMPELERSSNSAGATKVAGGATPHATPGTGDVAQLATGSEGVGSLRVQLDKVPDIRQERVAALRQAVTNGTFKISPERIAEAMLADGDKEGAQ